MTQPFVLCELAIAVRAGYGGAMRRSLSFALTCILVSSWAHAAPRSHIVGFGKWQAVELLAGSGGVKPVTMKVRPLYVDGMVREYTVGQPHEVTERSFVIQRALRLNDALPGEIPSPQLWKWERGGWLIVDRSSGRISPVTLLNFDPFYSSAAWYRDYVAYCGVSENGKRISLTVVQLGRRKPILHVPLEVEPRNLPDSACSPPVWFRQPMRVEFQQPDGQKLIFSPRRSAPETASAEHDRDSN